MSDDEEVILGQMVWLNGGTCELTLQDTKGLIHQKQSATHAQWELQRQSLFNPFFLTGV